MDKSLFMHHWGLVCLALGVLGCGKTDGGSDPEGEVLSADDATPLADLSADDTSKICDAVSTLYNPEAYVRGICIVESLGSSDDGQSCDAGVEACIASLEIEPYSKEECTETLDFTDCAATVGELNDCLARQRQAVERVSALRNCDDAARKGASTDWLREVPACEKLVDECPEAFGSTPSQTEGADGGAATTGGPGATGTTPRSIGGNVNGTPVDIRPTDSLRESYGSTSGYWTSSLEFGGAALWLWGETDLGQGLIRMPPSGPEASNWLCLDAVEVRRDEAAGTGTWASSSLSVLPQCDLSDAETLELTFAIGGAVSGTLRGDPVAWVSTGFSCGGSSCSLEFEEADTATTWRARWILEVDTSLQEGVSKTFQQATLIHPSGAGVVVCGGGGFVEWGADDQFHVEVHTLGPLAECPGSAVEGELSGVF